MGAVRRWTVGGALIESGGSLLLVRTRRRGGRHDWTPPGGVIDPGETLVDGLAREVAEETGLVATAFARIGPFLLMPGGCDEVVHFYCARVDLSDAAGGTHGLATENEETRVRIVPAAEAFRLAAEGGLDGAPTALAIFWLQLHRDRLRRDWT